MRYNISKSTDGTKQPLPVEIKISTKINDKICDFNDIYGKFLELYYTRGKVEDHCPPIFGLIFEEYIVASAFCNTISLCNFFKALLFFASRHRITIMKFFYKSGLRLMADDANENI